ncbi:putative hemolysin [Yersinia frederiksenii]|uniref:Putative hemolysin n=1 Tax=Yersinia frederiksenii TaxID=29484 RepID=A0A380PS54_YERFR|nr:hypothetical protein [Yersinia frederiksenii]EEQ12631.1 hemagglutinin/adhesin repeat protein [Yersinia frederiksenii ATCC 33641]SUP75767.1 putative hemolysin [Yersinia frederiksenii]
MTGSGSVSASKSKIDSDYTSVQEQTGFFAGKGGFDITVGEHTQLNGAVIGSTATADKNKLDTGSLGFSDLDNQASFKTSTSSMGLSSGGFTGSKDFISNMGGASPSRAVIVVMPVPPLMLRFRMALSRFAIPRNNSKMSLT